MWNRRLQFYWLWWIHLGARIRRDPVLQILWGQERGGWNVWEREQLWDQKLQTGTLHHWGLWIWEDDNHRVQCPLWRGIYRRILQKCKLKSHCKDAENSDWTYNWGYISQAAFTGCSYMIGLVIASFTCGYLSDMFGRKYGLLGNFQSYVNWE